jgi:hypothetical protein
MSTNNDPHQQQQQEKEAQFVEQVLDWRKFALERVLREAKSIFDTEVANLVEEWKEGGEDKEAPRSDRLSERQHAFLLELKQLIDVRITAFRDRLAGLHYIHCALLSKPPAEFGYRLPVLPPEEEVLVWSSTQVKHLLLSFGFDDLRDRCIELDEMVESERTSAEDLGDAILDSFLAGQHFNRLGGKIIVPQARRLVTAADDYDRNWWKENRNRL